jgi:hypothetical protein
MKIKSFILPVITAAALLVLVGYWVYEYKHFTVEPRVTGLDNRPQADPQDIAGQKPEGTMETFREVWRLFGKLRLLSRPRVKHRLRSGRAFAGLI